MSVSVPLLSPSPQMWRKRWFVLLSSKVLEYYKSEGGELRGVINLEDCHSVNSNLSHKRYIYIYIHENKMYSEAGWPSLPLCMPS